MKTRDEILKAMIDEMPYELVNKENILPYIKEAMQIYAQEQVKLFVIPSVKRSFWCKIGIHKLKYAEKYLHTAKVKCARENCNAEFIE